MATVFRQYPEVPVNVEPDVPHWTNLALRAVDKDMQAEEDRRTAADRNNLTTAREYADAKDADNRTAWAAADKSAAAGAVSAAKAYTDEKDTARREWAAAQDDSHLTAAKYYARTEDEAVLSGAKEYTDGKDTASRFDWATADKAVFSAALKDAAADATEKAAAARQGAVEDVTPALEKLAAESWLKPVPGGTVDANDYITSGYVGIISALSANLPIPAQGILEVFKFGSALTQRFTTYVVRVRVFVRHRTGAGNWNEWVEPGRSPVSIGTGGDLNTTVMPGPYDIATGSVANTPFPGAIGSVEVMQVARAVIQRFTVWAAGEPRVFIRSSLLDMTGWRDWYELPGAAMVAALRADVTTTTADLWKVKARAVGSGYKSAHLALNQPSGSTVETVSAASVRWPVTIGVTAHRARLHVRNWNWSVGTTADYLFAYKGAVSFTGLWAGPAEGKAFTAAPRRVLAPFTTDANGGEYVSPWFAYDFTEDVQHLVSVGFTNAEGQTNYLGRGGCWRTTDPADAGALDPDAALSVTCPFDVWLELEVPASTPVLAGFGDSNTVGTGTTLPVHDSWLAQYCRRNRALPMFLANHGSAAASWAGPEAQKWNRFRNVAQADAAVYFLHQNDLKAGVTLDSLKLAFRETLAILRATITPNVYAATITPGNKPEDVDTVRKGFNSWLKSRPEGLLDCFDFAAAVSDDDLKIRAGDSFDGLHFKTSGHAKIADALDARPVTPRVLTRGEIASLLAGAR